MTNRYRHVLWLALIGLFVACKKEDQVEIPKDFPVTLVAERWEPRSETRLFSDNREIKDAAVIRSFEERVGLLDRVESTTDLLGGESGLRFASELTAAFYTTLEDGANFDVVRKGTRFLFYAQETHRVNPSAPPSVDSLGFLRTMLSYTDALSTPATDGTRQTREVRVAHGNYKVLKLSAIAYELRRHSENDGSETVLFAGGGVLFNEFDADVAKFLGPADTLAVKEYSLICVRPK